MLNNIIDKLKPIIWPLGEINKVSARVGVLENILLDDEKSASKSVKAFKDLVELKE